MRQSDSYSSSRRPIAYVSVLGTIQLHLRSPFIIALWSAAFPGLGHLLLSKYLRGYLLFIWEIIINYNAHINLLMLYSFIGDFEMAKKVVNLQWMTFYIPTYIFAIWDSYRTTVDMNNNYILAEREGIEFKPFNMNSFEINYLDKRKPWIAAMWSLFTPGAGQLYIHRIPMAAFILIWWITSSYLSGFLPAFHYTLLGNFDKAKSLINMQWFMNIPSVYFFAIYDAYANSIEKNKLFEWEQSKFLTKEYQSHSFNLPNSARNTGDNMYVVSTFEHSIYLELAITAMQSKGIKKENIIAIPMDKRNERQNFLDSIHGSDGISSLDIPAILATLFGIFGSIYGFVLKWGPLLWGLIGIFLGCILGIIIKFITAKKVFSIKNNRRSTEVVLIIECLQDQIEMVKDTLWAHYALGVTKLDL